MEQQNDLTYTKLLLIHLSRISLTSSHIHGEFVDDSGNTVRYRSEDKENAFGWEVQILAAMLPDEYKDAKFLDEIKEIYYLLVNKYDNDLSRFGFNIRLLGACMNLMEKKDLLLDNISVGMLVNRKKSEAAKYEEVFEG